MLVKSLSLALLLLGLAAANTAQARETLRCPNGLVRHDLPRVLVLERCGEPVDVAETAILARPETGFGAKQRARGHRFGPGLGLKGRQEIWTYNFGPTRFMRQIRFIDGQVREIRTLGYGFTIEE